MNERIRLLAAQADVFEYKTYYDPTFYKSLINDDKVKKFAELIVRECCETVATTEIEGNNNAMLRGEILMRLTKHFGVAE